MIKELLQNTSVRRLEEILKARYGLGLRVDFMVSLSSTDASQWEPSVHEGSLVIPIKSENTYFATAKVPGVGHLNSEDISTISDLVSLILEPVFIRWSDQNRTNNFLIEEKDTDTSGASFLTPALFLNTTNFMRAQKIMHEIHEISGRWASFPFEHIEAQIKNANEIVSLGATSIMVKDITKMSPLSQDLLVDYLQTSGLREHLSEWPLILMSTSTPLNMLLADSNINPLLLDIVKQNLVEVDRLPLDQSLLREALELLLVEPKAIL